MPEDGIDFAEYESPEDDPIHPRFFNKIAEGVQKLITKYDFAYSRLQESVNECDDRLCRQIAAEVKWRRKRERYAQCYIRQHQSRNKPARCPGPQYHFEVISLTDRTHNPIKGRVGPDICVWFPRKLWLRDCPRVDWPLPLKDGEMERYEKETILAAIYDFSMKGGRRIADGLNLEHYDKLTGINLPEGRYEGLVKQIPAKHLYHLERWLQQFEDDLQTCAGKGASGNADERPGDLMYLSVVKQNYIISQRSLDRDIRSGKLKVWRAEPRAKRKVSKAACDLIYDAQKR